MTKNLVCFLILFLTVQKIPGQPLADDRADGGNLSLRIKTISFIEDNEFFNPIVEGYTLLGFFFHPELVYNPSSRVTLRGGAHLLKYYGKDIFSQIRPVFAITLNFTEKTSLTLGTLSGPDNHHFFDPHFYRERLYNQYMEDGIEIESSNEKFFTDTWISWENFIFKGDTTREQFTFGESFRYTSRPIADFIGIEIPVQLQAKHFGGQISNFTEPVQSFFNVAAGLRVNFDLAGKKYGQVGIEYLKFLNALEAGDSIDGINHGNASWYRLHYSYKAIHAEAGYWQAHNFYAPNGNPIYGSISDIQPGLVIHDRKLLTSSVYLKFPAANSLELYFGIDLYYDTDLKIFDQAYTLHLDFDKLINLISSKRRIKENMN